MMMLIERAIEEFLKHDTRTQVAGCEGDIIEWFQENHKSLGFEVILRKQWNKTPDFITLRNGKETKVEIEYRSSSFLKHRHKLSEADVVVCCVKDVELDKRIEVITLNHIFIDYWGEIYPAIDPTKPKPGDEDGMRALIDNMSPPKKKEQKRTDQ